MAINVYMLDVVADFGVLHVQWQKQIEALCQGIIACQIVSIMEGRGRYHQV